MSSTEITDEMLARHLAGESSLDEDEAVAAWIEASDANRIEYERLLRAWSARETMPDLDIDRAWSRVSARINQNSQVTDAIPIRRPRSWPAILARIAAAVVLIAGVRFAWIELRAAPAEITHVAGADGLTVELGDGSRAVLEPGARLVVARDFGQSGREVRLVGAARFTATHDDTHQFTVLAAGHRVVDVGTVFRVAARDDGPIEVAVIEGSVAVSDSVVRSASDTLVAGQSGRFAMDGARIISGVVVDTNAPTAVPRLNVVDLGAGELLHRLAGWYDVPIVLADTALAARPITATIPLDSLDGALEVVALLLDVTPARGDSGIVLR